MDFYKAFSIYMNTEPTQRPTDENHFQVDFLNWGTYIGYNIYIGHKISLLKGW